MGINRIFLRNKQRLGQVYRRSDGSLVKTSSYNELTPKPIIHPRHLRLKFQEKGGD